MDPDFISLYKEILIQKRTLDVIYGQVVGHSLLNYDEIERQILDENPSIVLLEFGKLMGFRLLDLFSTLDKDGSRTLDREEIERGLRVNNHIYIRKELETSPFFSLNTASFFSCRNI